MTKTIEQQQEELSITAEMEMERNPRESYEHKKNYFLKLFATMSIHDQLNFIYEGIVNLGLAKQGSELMDRYNKHQKEAYDFIFEEGKSGYGIQTISNVNFFVTYVA